MFINLSDILAITSTNDDAYKEIVANMGTGFVVHDDTGTMGEFFEYPAYAFEEDGNTISFSYTCKSLASPSVDYDVIKINLQNTSGTTVVVTTSTVDKSLTDIKVNNTSVISNHEVNLVTNSAYNSSTNPFAMLSDTSEVDSYSFGTDGYVRFKSGFQIAWVSYTFTGNFSSWAGSVYFLNSGTIQNWAKPFTAVYYQGCQADITYWTTSTYPGTTTPGMVRLLRINGQNNASVPATIFAFGKWT